MKAPGILGCIALIVIIIFTTAACNGKDVPSDDTTTPGVTHTASTQPAASELQLIQGYDDAVLVASDNSPEEWKSKAQYVCTGGELPDELRIAIRKGNETFMFAPGEYRIDGEGRHIYVGSNTTLVGAYKIVQPQKLQEMLYPDPTYMAVFKTTAELPSQEICDNSQYGVVKISGSRNVTLDSIALSGYTVLNIDNSRTVKIQNVIVHNYRGTYPDGEWCNMGYGRATGSLWISGNTGNIEILNCQIQCSSHHGINLHSRTNTMVAKDIRIAGTRALYCGSGMLRGETESSYPEAAARVPETGGYGYLDWSVAFDLCESQNVQNMLVEDCYALEGWKCGFYTEPEGSGGPVSNIRLIRCRSDYAGKRTEIPGSDPKAVIIKEGENANFFFQGGYFEDCISVGGQKSGWYIHPERPKANGTGDGLAKLVNCGDLGSTISLATEGGGSLYADGFWSLNAEEEAIWLYGSGDFHFKDLTILCKNQSTSPIMLGKTQRLFFRYSRDKFNALSIAPRGKYDTMRISMSSSSIDGTIYNLPESVKAAVIAEGSKFNGVADPEDTAGKITLKRDNSTVINIGDYVN